MFERKSTKIIGVFSVLVIVLFIAGVLAWRVMKEQRDRGKVAVVKGKRIKAPRKEKQPAGQESQEEQQVPTSSQPSQVTDLEGEARARRSTSEEQELPPLLTGPSGIIIFDLRTGRRLAISWQNPSSDIFSFVRIYRSQSLGDLGVLILDNYQETSFTDSGLTPWVTYYYVVKAVDVFGRETTNQDWHQGTPTDATPPSITASGDMEVEAGNQAEIVAQLYDEGGVERDKVFLYYKQKDEEDFPESGELMTRTSGDSYRATYKAAVPAGEVTKEGLDYYVKAQDTSGNKATDPEGAPAQSYEITPPKYWPIDQE